MGQLDDATKRLGLPDREDVGLAHAAQQERRDGLASTGWTRTLLFTVVIIFNLPMWAFLPAIVDYFIARRCDAIGEPCDSASVSASAALWSNYAFIIPCNVSNSLTALALGTLSDRFGRRPLLLLCVATQCAGSLGSLMVVLLRLDLWWFAPGFVVNGLGGASWVMVVLVMASLGDTATDDADRARLFSVAMGLYYACSAAGPLMGGEITAHIGRVFSGDCEWCHGGDLQAVFLIFFLSNLVIVVLVATCFYETADPALIRRNREAAREASATTGWFRLNFIRPTIQPLILVGQSRWLALLTVVYSFCFMGMADRSSLLTLYAKKAPFDMADDEVGWFLSSLGLARAMAVFVVLPVLLRWLSLLQAARVGILLATVFTACIGLARDKVDLFAIATASGMDAVWDASLRVLFSAAGSAVNAGEGEVLGVIGFLQVFLGSVAPICFQSIYAATVTWCPAFSFYLIAGLMASGLLVSAMLRDAPTRTPPHHRKTAPETEPLLEAIQ